MRREEMISRAQGGDRGQSIAHEALHRGLADRLTISSTVVELEMFGANSEPGRFADRQLGSCRNFEGIRDLDPRDAVDHTTDRAVAILCHSDDAKRSREFQAGAELHRVARIEQAGHA